MILIDFAVSWDKNIAVTEPFKRVTKTWQGKSEYQGASHIVPFMTGEFETVSKKCSVSQDAFWMSDIGIMRAAALMGIAHFTNKMCY